MKKNMRLVLALSTLLTAGALLPAQVTQATSTEEKYQMSKIIIVTEKNDVPFYAEPGRDSLTLGYYPKGTIFVPINQTRNAVENKLYNLCIRFDGAVGWLASDDVALSRK